VPTCWLQIRIEVLVKWRLALHAGGVSAPDEANTLDDGGTASGLALSPG
jgi:hypothetical protein